MKKKILSMFFAVCTAAVTTVTASADVGVTIDGSIISFDVPPQIINDRTMVPMRAIFEALGAEVEWYGEEQLVYGVKDDTVVVLQIGVPAIMVNDEVTELDAAPLIIDDRTLVPVRAISEAFGLSVNWDGKTQTVIINSNSAETSSSETQGLSQTDADYDNSDSSSEQGESDDSASDLSTEQSESDDSTSDLSSDSYSDQSAADTSSDDTDLGHQVLEIVNQYRSEAGLVALEWDDELAAVALAHSEDMVARNYFDHTNLDGLTPFDRFKNYGISYTAAAENIAMGQKTAEAVMNSWMNSTGHHDNIMNASFRKMGIGVAYNSSGQIYWTQCFTN